MNFVARVFWFRNDVCALGLIDVNMRQVLAVSVGCQSSIGCQVVAGSQRAGAGRRHPEARRARVGAGTVPVLGRVGVAAGRRVAAAWASSEAVEPFRAAPSAGLLSPWGTAVHRSREVVPALQRRHQRRDQLSL